MGAVFIDVIHDDIAQAQMGLSGLSVTASEVDAVSLLSLGFLWGDDWAECSPSVSTSWTSESLPSTNWTPESDPVTSWTEIDT